MPAVRVEDTVIRYEIRRSPRAKRIRITVSPGRVFVSAPPFTPRRTIVAFAESKRRWIAEKSSAMRERQLEVTPREFVSGAEVLFRGRFLKLRVGKADARLEADSREGQIRDSLYFASGFHVTVANGLTRGEQEKRTRALVMDWLRRRAFEDARHWARIYGVELGADPTGIRIGNQKTLWGSCSARGVVSLNWRLIALPKSVFEYVVVHELCHLVQPNHSGAFWDLVGSLLPDFRERRAWLKGRGVALR